MRMWNSEPRIFSVRARLRVHIGRCRLSIRRFVHGSCLTEELGNTGVGGCAATPSPAMACMERHKRAVLRGRVFATHRPLLCRVEVTASADRIVRCAIRLGRWRTRGAGVGCPMSFRLGLVKWDSLTCSLRPPPALDHRSFPPFHRRQPAGLACDSPRVVDDHACTNVDPPGRVAGAPSPPCGGGSQDRTRLAPLGAQPPARGRGRKVMGAGSCGSRRDPAGLLR